MASVASLFNVLQVDTSGAIRAFDQAANGADAASRRMSGAYIRETRRMREATEEMGRSIRQVFDGLQMITGFAIGAESIRKIGELADGFTDLQSRVRNATRETGDFTSVFGKIYQISQQNGVALETTAALFQNLRRAADDLGKSNADVLTLADTVQKLGIIGGSSTQQLQNGLLQLSQALASGRVNAQDMRSVIEDTPEIAFRIAQGMHMTVGQMRQAIAAGQVMSSDVFDALLSQSKLVNKQWEQMPTTMERGMQTATNSLQRFIGEMDKTFHVTSSIGDGFKGLASAIDGATDSLKAHQDIISQIYPMLQKIMQFKPPAQLGLELGVGALGRAAGKLPYLHDKLAGGLDPRYLMIKPPVHRETALPDHPEFGPPLPKQNQKYKDFLKDLKEEVKEQQDLAQGKKEQKEIDDALYKAEEKLGRAMTGAERAEVTALARAKARAKEQQEGAKKAEEAQKKYKKAIDDTLREEEKARASDLAHYQEMEQSLAAQKEQLDFIAAGETFAAKQAAERLRFEKEIAKLNPVPGDKSGSFGLNIGMAAAGAGYDPRASLLSKFDANQAEEFANNLKKVREELLGTKESYDQFMERMAAESGLTERQAEELDKYYEALRKFKEAGDDLAEQHAMSVFDEAKARRVTEEVEKRKRAVAEQVEELQQENRQRELIANHQELQAEYEKIVFEWRQQYGRELTDQEKALAQQLSYQREYNRLAADARDIIEQTKTDDEKRADQLRHINDLFSAGLLTVQQYQKAVANLSPAFQRFSDFFHSAGQTISSALGNAITNGGKFSDVLKQIEKQLASMALQKLILDPFFNMLSVKATNWLQGRWPTLPANPQSPFAPGNPQPPWTWNPQTGQWQRSPSTGYGGPPGGPPGWGQQGTGSPYAPYPGTRGPLANDPVAAQQTSFLSQIAANTGVCAMAMDPIIKLLNELAKCSCGSTSTTQPGVGVPTPFAGPLSPTKTTKDMFEEITDFTGGGGNPFAGFLSAVGALGAVGGLQQRKVNGMDVPAVWGGGITPTSSYIDLTRALSNRAQQQADASTGIARAYFENQAKMWNYYGGLNGGLGGFGVAPGIVNNSTFRNWINSPLDSVQAPPGFFAGIRPGAIQVDGGDGTAAGYDVGQDHWLPTGADIERAFNQATGIRPSAFDQPYNGGIYMPPQTGSLGPYAGANLNDYYSRVPVYQPGSGRLAGYTLRAPDSAIQAASANPSTADWDKIFRYFGSPLSSSSPSQSYAPIPLYGDLGNPSGYPTVSNADMMAQMNALLNPNAPATPVASGRQPPLTGNPVIDQLLMDQKYGYGHGGVNSPAYVRHFASGGHTAGGQLLRVNEKGIEYFQPDTAGTIIPHDELGGGGVYVTVNNYAPVGVSVNHGTTADGQRAVDIVIDEMVAGRSRNGGKTIQAVRQALGGGSRTPSIRR